VLQISNKDFHVTLITDWWLSVYYRRKILAGRMKIQSLTKAHLNLCQLGKSLNLLTQSWNIQAKTSINNPHITAKTPQR